jgi:hypothetical protein
MTPFANRLQNAYFHANEANIRAGHGRLRKGQFMQSAYPEQKYKNESSARRQFNKVITGETSGQRIEKRGGVPRIVSEITHGKHKGRLVGGGLEGLWKINVHYKYDDEDTGEQATPTPCDTCENAGVENHSDVRSFIATSYYYRTMEDLPYLNIIVPGVAAEYLEKWQQRGSMPVNYYDMIIEIEPIRRADVRERYNLDDVEIE